MNIIREVKNEFPTLWRLCRTSIETANEIEQGKKAFAFLNNALSFGVVAANLRELTNESIAYQNQPENKAKLEAAIVQEFGNEANELILIYFRHILSLIFMNIGGGAALERAVREYKNGLKES